MTPQQRQTFLQARAASRISALASTVTPSDDVSAITTPTGIQVSTQVTQIRQDQPTAVTSGPFGGRASHRG
jgi:hypothetical protein